ncbi:MAG TPA: TonB-dependent receptor [Vicinamibacterales bacterium]|nr:TonB-dependent receptor [Vicinamibacterales bacterium]
MSRLARPGQWLVVLIFILAIAAASASAQSTTGSISGTVRDQSKAILPGATVEVRNLDTGAARSIASDHEGRYRALNLPPGRYVVVAELSGFTKATANDIVVQIGRDVPVDLTLSVGAVSESVTVTGESAVLDLSAAVVGGVVSTKQIAELPLNGRSFMQLATLQPGVVVSRATERDFTGGFGGTQVSIAGARPEQTGYLLEGTNISDISDKAPSSVAGVLLGVDTVQEFSVQTHGYSAEFGRAAGGIISAVTKSGTNSFRGTLFEFFRDSKLDAKGYFDAGDAPPPFTRNQFGGTLGGPIVKNKLFFFGSYEGLRERLGTTRIARVPNADAHRGLLPNPGGGLRNVGVNATIQPYLDLLYPLPNGRDFGDGTAELAHAPTEPTNEHFFVGKVDWNLRQKDNFLIRLSSDRSDNQVWAFDHPSFSDVTTTDARYVTSQWQRIFTSSVLNEARFAANRTARELIPTPLIDVPRNLFFVNEPYFGYIEVPGILTSTGNVDDSANYTQNLFQVSDTLTLHAGRHTWKTGFDFQRYHFDGVSNSRLGGAYRFRSVEEMLTLRRSATAQADRYTGNLPGTDTDRHMRQNYAAFFLHDDFRLSNRLSLSLGVRYEFVTTPHELNGKVAGLLSLNDLEAGPKGITPGSPLFDNPSKNGLAPRVGVSWMPFGDNKTTIRGGTGIFYQPLTVSFYRGTTFREYPYFAGVDIRQPTVFGPAIQSVLAGGAGTASVQKRSEFIFFDTKQPYNVQWYLNSQHEMRGGFVAEVGYMGSRGVNLPYYGDPNATPSDYLPDGTKRIVPGAALRYPSWGRIRTRTTGAESEYHGLTLGLQKRLSSGLQFQANYTYSRSIDTWSGGLQGSSDFLTGAGSAVDWWDIEFERGRSSFDVPHNFVFNAVYTLPSSEDRRGLAGALANGWQLSGIVSLSSGMPFHPVIGFDRAGDRQSDTDMQRPSWAAGFGPDNAVTGNVDQWFNASAFVLPAAGTFGNVARNALRGPNLRVVDFSIFKNQAVVKSMLQFRVEIFNLFDRANFNPPADPRVFNTDGTLVPGSGRITSLATTPRQVQFGIKYLF